MGTRHATSLRSLQNEDIWASKVLSYYYYLRTMGPSRDETMTQGMIYDSNPTTLNILGSRDYQAKNSSKPSEIMPRPTRQVLGLCATLSASCDHVFGPSPAGHPRVYNSYWHSCQRISDSRINHALCATVAAPRRRSPNSLFGWLGLTFQGA